MELNKIPLSQYQVRAQLLFLTSQNFCRNNRQGNDIWKGRLIFFEQLISSSGKTEKIAVNINIPSCALQLSIVLSRLLMGLFGVVADAVPPGCCCCCWFCCCCSCTVSLSSLRSISAFTRSDINKTENADSFSTSAGRLNTPVESNVHIQCMHLTVCHRAYSTDPGWDLGCHQCPPSSPVWAPVQGWMLLGWQIRCL